MTEYQKCYKCYKNLVTSQDFKERELDTSTYTITHKEHIIQNALGGFLHSLEILCKSCGGILNEEVDVKFIKTFVNICNSLEINLDRETRNPAFVTGTYQLYGKDENIDARFYKNIWKPYKNSYLIDAENNQITLFLADKNSKSHLLKLVQADKAFNEDYNIVDVLDLSSVEGGLKIPFNLENNSFKKGMAKISTGFACSKNIDRNKLNCIFDGGNFKDQLIFFPLLQNEFLKQFEDSFSDEFSPYHLLYLFNVEVENTNNLICYVDLFSTFKGFMLLGVDFNGDVNEFYSRNLLNNEILNKFNDLEFVGNYKAQLRSSFKEICRKVSDPYQKNVYMQSVKKSNHEYFYRLMMYISLLNMERHFE